MPDLLNQPEFQSELEKLAVQRERPVDELRQQAADNLTEMRSTRNPLAVWMFAALHAGKNPATAPAKTRTNTVDIATVKLTDGFKT